ncbi:MAG: phosphomannomutase/phosphoglucomutase [Candidatus Nanopelagicales bacterium]
MNDLSDVIKAYDVRGIYPDQINEDLARKVGAAFVEVLGIRQSDGGPGAVVVGHDMRPSGPSLVAAFTEGVTSHGCDVVQIGLCSTDGIYYAAGSYELPGAMFTASHNPAEYNGIKLCKVGASPVGQESGLAEITELILNGIPSYEGEPGKVSERDSIEGYAEYLRSMVNIEGIRPLKVVADAGNGMAGLTAPVVLGPLPLDVTEMYYELDGTFPNHEANPIEPENLKDLQAEVLRQGADIGLAFDGDADRCFVVDQNGEPVNPSTLTALIAVAELAKDPGSPVIHNLITSDVVPEVIVENGGTPVRTRVGHSFIKAKMAETGAIFGGEHSGHFYFRDFWRADSGMLAALHVLAALGHTDPGTTLSEILAPYSRYVQSGEINSTVDSTADSIAQIRANYEGREDVSFDELDGLTVRFPDRWFSVRPSNTEPLLRLNVEAETGAQMEQLRDEVLAQIRG